ncbi:MAG: hypothetical protein Ct9H90mP28_5810 [Paracoccaceae bacterium]|nr:MAG: hypothetical protein Ct9H90mP28_5810 [Paracoccaceae bacterium]
MNWFSRELCKQVENSKNLRIMVNLDLIEFLDKHDINWMPINLEFKQWGFKNRKVLKPYVEDKQMPN